MPTTLMPATNTAMGTDMHMPLICEVTIQPEWIDLNQHLNSMYYLHVAREGSGGIMNSVGIDQDYVRSSGCSVFLRENHISYRRELRLGDPVRVTTWVIGADARDVHLLVELSHATEGWSAALVEYRYGHVDSRARRSADWSDHAARTFARLGRETAETYPGLLPSLTIRLRTPVV